MFSRVGSARAWRTLLYRLVLAASSRRLAELSLRILGLEATLSAETAQRTLGAGALAAAGPQACPSAHPVLVLCCFSLPGPGPQPENT